MDALCHVIREVATDMADLVVDSTRMSVSRMIRVRMNFLCQALDKGKETYGNVSQAVTHPLAGTISRPSCQPRALLLADTEAGKYFAQQIIAGELTRDGTQCLVSKA